MTKALKVTRDIVNLESLNGVAGGSLISRFLPSVNEKFKAFVEAFKPVAATSSAEFNEKQFLARTKTINYLDINHLKVIDTIGVATNLVRMSESLECWAKCLEELEDHLIEPYVKYLARLIKEDTYRQDKAFTFQSFASFTEGLTHAGSEYNKQIAPNLQKERPFKDLVSRNNDWEIIYKTLAKTEHSLSKVDLEDVQKGIKQASTYLTLLEEKVKNEDFGDTSKEVAKTLAEGTYSVAHALEQYSSAYYAFMTLRKLVTDMGLMIQRLS